MLLAVNTPVNQPNKIQIDYLKPQKNFLEFGGKLFTRSLEIEEIELFITGRENSKEFYFPVGIHHYEEQTKKNLVLIGIDIRLKFL